MLLFAILGLLTGSLGVSDAVSSLQLPNQDSNNNELAVKRLIVDTDAGADDAVGLLYLLGSQQLGWNVQVEAITTVTGNTLVDNVIRNVLKVLDTAKRLDVPVYRGQNYSTLITPHIDDYFGHDGFGDFEYPNPPSEEDYLQASPAVVAITDMVRSNPGVYSLLCIGPLTNIALAIKLYPELLSNLEDVFVVGGSVEGSGNMSPGVEYNFYFDPEAAHIVLNEATRLAKPIIMLPYEAFAKYAVIPMVWRTDVLGTVDSPQVQLLNKAEVLQLKGEEWEAADSILAAVATNMDLVTDWRDLHVQVETCGRLTRGACLSEPADAAKNKTANVRAAINIDVDEFQLHLLQTLNPGGSTNAARLR